MTDVDDVPHPDDAYDDDYVEMPPDRGGVPKVLVVIGLILVMFAALVVGARSWYQRQVDPPGPPGEDVVVEIPTGSRLTDLGSLLSAPDVVANGTLFRFWIRNKDIELQAGRYTFQRNSSFEEVLEVLEAGPDEVANLSLLIREGLRVDEIVEAMVADVPRFTAEEVEEALADPANRSRFVPADLEVPEGVPILEGMLFPSTYEVGPRDTPSSVVRRMVDEMDRQAEAAGIEGGLSGDNLPPLSAYEVLIVASLIERETGNPQESPKIARVIYNRLLRGRSEGISGLGIDATSQYLAAVTGEPLDLESDSPYNTRNRLELPPTPIAAPGRASIDAALNPAPGPWLYYVLEEPGVHYFTDDYDDFLRAKQECEEKELGCGGQ